MRTYRVALACAASLVLLFTAFGLVWGTAVVDAAEPSDPPANSILVKGFEFTGNDSIETWMLQDVVADAVGEELDFDGLLAVAARVTEYYRERGYWLAQAYLPEQDVSEGVVLIAVREGYYGDVKVESQANVPVELAPRILREIRPGDVIYGPALESAILLLSDVPGVDATASLSPGRVPGTADLHVVLRRVESLVLGMTANNHGSGSAGGFRSIFNARWTNPRGYGDHFSFAFMGSSPETNFARFAYEAPINHRELRLNIEYSMSNYALEDAFSPIDASGSTRRFRIVANHPVFRGDRLNLNAEAGYSQTDIHEKAILESNRTVSGFSSALRAERRTLNGGAVSATLDVRLGDVKFGSKIAADMDAIGAKTAGAFRKVSADIMMMQPLGPRAAFTATLSGQTASKNLDPTEKMAIGGIEGVRAYSPDEPSVDEGLLLRLEARRSVSLPRLPSLRQAMVFLDAGQGSTNKHPWPGAGDTHVTLAGAGVGLVWELGPVTSELVYALPIATGQGVPKQGGRLWWQATLPF